MRELWVEIEKSMPLELKKVFVESIANFCIVFLSDVSDISFLKTYGVRIASKEGGDIKVLDKSSIDLFEVSSKPLCLRLVVKDRAGEEEAIKAAEKGFEYVAVSCPNWKVIPFENLIAKTRGVTKLLAEVSSSEEARVVLNTLEIGVDGIILKTDDIDDVKLTLKILTALDREVEEKNVIELFSAEIVSTKQLSIGARVCIDTCDLMSPGEGMLLGCGSAGLFLIQAEVAENPHVEPRPFRVNAGPVSLYILVPNNTTRYLSELRAGDEVLIVDRKGKFRNVVVGRIKIERRPFILVEAKIKDTRLKIIVQNAETIRFVTKDGSKSVAELKQGDEILVYHQQGGRHFGTLVEEETVIEK